MRISGKAKELAKVKYIRLSQEISSRHYANIKHHESMMPRGGAMKAAIDKEHVEMAQEIAEAYANCYLESFLLEGLLPDANDLREFKSEIENIINRHKGNEFWTPGAGTGAGLTFLPQQIFGRFASKVKQLELEKSLQKPAQSANSHQINIQGNNYGAIQQGGQNNIQNVNEGVEDEIK